MIVSNNKNYIVSKSIFNQIDLDTNNQLYVLNFHSVEFGEYQEVVAQYLSDIKNCDKVILLTEWEAILDRTWCQAQDYLIEQGIKKKNIMIMDSGSSTNGQYNHIWHPILTSDLMNSDPRSYPRIHLRDRIYHYNSLARIPKPFRVLFTAELIRRKIDQFGLVTCGGATEGKQGNWGNVYEHFVEDDIRYMFPCTVNKTDVNRSNFFDDMIDQFSNCAIHVALETSFERIPHSKNGILLNNQWDRIFPTEKTILAFSMFQLPLVLSVPGTVDYVRSLGFDMFDDIIDHSYDREPDPEKRITMVVDELERLINLDVREKYDLEDRLFANADWVRKAAEINFGICKQKLHGWFYQ